MTETTTVPPTIHEGHRRALLDAAAETVRDRSRPGAAGSATTTRLPASSAYLAPRS